ncbi:hypothetical protein [Jatrophihabitans fulvus]
MVEPDDETARIDAALSASQQREREEREEDLRRQAETDRRVAEALAHKRD